MRSNAWLKCAAHFLHKQWKDEKPALTRGEAVKSKKIQYSHAIIRLHAVYSCAYSSTRSIRLIDARVLFAAKPTW